MSESVESNVASDSAIKPTPVGKFGFRRSDTGAAILQVEFDGKYTDINIDNYGFDGNNALAGLLQSRYQIYLLVNQFTSLVEAIRTVGGVFVNYSYDEIVEKMKVAPKEEA